MIQRSSNSQVKSILALLLVVAVLAMANWHLLDLAVDKSPLTVTRTEVAAEPASPQLPVGRREQSLAVSDYYKETIARPLFNPDRRPVVAAKAIASQPKGVAVLPPLQMQLVGLVANGARGQRALVRPISEPNGIWVAVGEDVKGWRLREIGDDRAVFEAGGTRQVLLMTKAIVAP